MNREIIYRGKRCSDGEWVYGFYVESKHSWQGHKPHKSWIVPNAISNGGFFNVLGRYAVKDDTVGEFTGLRDKNGKKIFEGDIVRRRESAFGYVKTGVVKYDCHLGAFVLEYESYGETCKSTFDNEFSENDGYCTIRGTYSYEVIGNIYDNSELLSTK